jgi:hypothetical protein
LRLQLARPLWKTPLLRAMCCSIPGSGGALLNTPTHEATNPPGTVCSVSYCPQLTHMRWRVPLLALSSTVRWCSMSSQTWRTHTRHCCVCPCTPLQAPPPSLPWQTACHVVAAHSHATPAAHAPCGWLQSGSSEGVASLRQSDSSMGAAGFCCSAHVCRVLPLLAGALSL